MFQLQSGILYKEVDLETSTVGSYGANLVLRRGIKEPFELSAVIQTAGISGTQSSSFDVSRFQIGGRYHFSDQKGIIPNAAIQTRMLINVAASVDIGNNTILGTSNRFLENYVIFTNLSMRSQNEFAESFGYALDLLRNVGERWGVFIEMFGRLSDPSSNYDAGFAYVVNSNLQLDVAAGVDSKADWFTEIGFPWRLVSDGSK